jgi:oligopeptide/dipeptide ABC transporter ATP-binding protein
VRAAVKDFGWNYAPAVLTVHYNATRRGRGQDRSRTARPGASEARGNLRAEAGHAYTKALLGSIRKPDPRADPRSVLHGEVPSPIDPPSGCRFHPRCLEYVGDVCSQKDPKMGSLDDGTLVACHMYGEGS